MTATAKIIKFPQQEICDEDKLAFLMTSDATFLEWKETMSPDAWVEITNRFEGKRVGLVDRNIAKTIIAYNKRYAVIVDGTVQVYDRKTKQLHKPEEFFKADPSETTIEVTDKDGNVSLKTLSRPKLWFDSLARTQFTGKCLFPLDRNRDGKDFRTDLETRPMWNTWKGWGVKPQEGDCDLFLDHLFEVVCNRNPEHYNYTLDWMAHVIQRPWIKPRVALVLWSKEKQTGKSMVGEIFRDIIGRDHSTLINKNGQVTGRFADLGNAVFCQSEEALFSGDPATVNVTKDLITNAVQPVEHKFKQGVEAVPSYTAFMFTSNSEKAVHVSDGEERFFVLKVSSERKGDKAYFQSIYDQMRKEGGNEAFLHMLQERNISNFQPWANVPKTHALGEMALEHEEPVKKAILEAMRAGGITIRDRNGDQTRFIPWLMNTPLRIDAEDLWQAFSREAAGYGEDRGTQTKIGMALDALGLVADKARTDTRRNLKAYYVLKPLAEAFETVAAHYDVTPEHLGFGDLDDQADRLQTDALTALDTLADFLGWELDRKHLVKAEIENMATADGLASMADSVE